MERSAAPEQGDLFGFGVVIAVAAVLLVDLRFDGDWSNGVLLAVEAGALGLAFGLALRGPRPAEPVMHRSAMAVAGLLPALLALGHLAKLLGAEEQFGEDLVWIGPAFAGLAAAVAVYFRTPAAGLVAALSVAAGVFAFVVVVIEPSDGETVYRWIAAGLAAAFVIAAVTLRSLGERRHSTQLANAAGLILIGLAYAIGFLLIFDEYDSYRVEREWEIVLMVGSLLVIACAIAFRERGTGWIGAIALGVTLFGVAGESDETPSFVGWPLALVAAALLVFVVALLRPAARR